MNQATAIFQLNEDESVLQYSITVSNAQLEDIVGIHIHKTASNDKALGIINPNHDNNLTITTNSDGSLTFNGFWNSADITNGAQSLSGYVAELTSKDTTQETTSLHTMIHFSEESGLEDLMGAIKGTGIDNVLKADLMAGTHNHNSHTHDDGTTHAHGDGTTHTHDNTTTDNSSLLTPPATNEGESTDTTNTSASSTETETTNLHDHSTHSHFTDVANTSEEDNFTIPTFTDFDRYNENASYNKAPFYEFPINMGLPLTYNLNFEDFVKAVSGNNPLDLPNKADLPFYSGIPDIKSENSYQWDSFPAGEAQQFLTVSVDIDKINVENTPLSGDDDSPVQLEARSTSTLDRPFTISTTVTPFNAGPIPHIHWAEDEWFVLLQGEIDSWVMSPSEDAYDLYEFPADENGDPLTPPEYNGPPALAKDKVQDFYYGHLTPGQAVFLPRGYAHGYRNVSPTGEPLVFLTIWSRDIDNGYPEGGIEEFFTLPEPRIGRFYDTSEDAALYGSLYNKNIGSEDATSNQQRFVDYKNTFPDYYVAMSGNFGDFLEEGGNWNPDVYKDTQPIPTAPPDYWNPDLPEPWNTDSSDPDAEEYYPAPAPNAPSDSVNFATPFDPQVINRIYITLNHGESSEQLEELLVEYIDEAEIFGGNLYSDFYQDTNTPANYFLVEKWNEYSDLDVFTQTSNYEEFISNIDTIADITAINVDTIQPDKFADSNQTIIGKFQAKPGTREQVIELSNEAVANTIQETGNITYEFYENPVKADEWIFFEKYTDGENLTLHFEQSYLKDFFANFATLLVGNGIADGDVEILPTDDPASSFYDLQKQGLQLLTDLFQSSPELTVSLEANDNGILSVVNGADTSGIGIVLSLTTDAYTNVPMEYGIFTVDDVSGAIDGVNPNDAGYLDKVREAASILFATNVNNAEGMGINRDVFVETAQQYAFYQVTNGSIQDNAPQVEFSFNSNNFFTTSDDTDLEFAFSNGLESSAKLNGPVKGLNSIIAQQQTQGDVLLDTSTLVNKTLAADIHISRNADYKPVMAGFYKVSDASGAIADPVTGATINPGDANYSSTIMGEDFEKISLDVSALSAKVSETDLKTQFAGGEIYAPFIVVDDSSKDEEVTYYGYAEANVDGERHIISLGNNTFGIEDMKEGGDRDFNDLVFQLEFNFSEPPYAIT